MSYQREMLTTAQLLGIQEPRACRVSDTSNLSVPYMDFDHRNQDSLPCNEVVPELGTTSLDFPVPVVPTKGCFVQRKAGMCPRGFTLTPQEEETLEEVPQRPSIAK